jgi:DNA repair protein RadA/Sms
MSKIKTSFFCSNCGYESPKWSGKCPSCSQWNTFLEEVVSKNNQKEDNWKTYHSEKRSVHAVRLDDVVINEEKRIVTNDAELSVGRWYRSREHRSCCR